jgi:hypothetical protein
MLFHNMVCLTVAIAWRLTRDNDERFDTGSGAEVPKLDISMDQVQGRKGQGGSGNDRNFPCQTLKIRNVSLVVMGS